MIYVAGSPFEPDSSWNSDKVFNDIIDSLEKAPFFYSFPTEKELLFEINIRKNTIESSIKMDEGESVFATFKNARCNPEYWNLTQAGGFLLKPEVKPSDAVDDIFENSGLYSFECATSCVIIFYHAVLKTIGSDSFDYIFQNLYLYSWNTDYDLGLHSIFTDHYIPGDVVYFNNPDVDPETSWFRGVNAVALKNNLFFGHGFSIRTEKKMVEGLNKYRTSDSKQSAYLTSLITRPSYNQLAGFFNPHRWNFYKPSPIIVHHNKDSISFRQYLSELGYE
ncbi:protein-glutamine gamma-glutamyltransferase [Halobacillus yeomjeoni]|uniref:protein-glutamine gamma-glutamyltransferase n=1 Tax=Halobacillus yeomjeoni TaxID=311194 RepID=UPI001CD2FA69|nr:protein-glutamine gamma-glutamyltransferase [Halobacillus yeomjeoni]MCA0983057.1 protein-glutamine gamma-glutamyltransferase [Halobacillus yeomjeoni]